MRQAGTERCPRSPGPSIPGCSLRTTGGLIKSAFDKIFYNFYMILGHSPAEEGVMARGLHWLPTASNGTLGLPIASQFLLCVRKEMSRIPSSFCSSYP